MDMDEHSNQLPLYSDLVLQSSKQNGEQPSEQRGELAIRDAVPMYAELGQSGVDAWRDGFENMMLFGAAKQIDADTHFQTSIGKFCTHSATTFYDVPIGQTTFGTITRHRLSHKWLDLGLNTHSHPALCRTLDSSAIASGFARFTFPFRSVGGSSAHAAVLRIHKAGWSDRPFVGLDLMNRWKHVSVVTSIGSNPGDDMDPLGPGSGVSVAPSVSQSWTVGEGGYTTGVTLTANSDGLTDYNMATAYEAPRPPVTTTLRKVPVRSVEWWRRKDALVRQLSDRTPWNHAPWAPYGWSMATSDRMQVITATAWVDVLRSVRVSPNFVYNTFLNTKTSGLVVEFHDSDIDTSQTSQTSQNSQSSRPGQSKSKAAEPAEGAASLKIKLQTDGIVGGTFALRLGSVGVQGNLTHNFATDQCATAGFGIHIGDIV